MNWPDIRRIPYVKRMLQLLGVTIFVFFSGGWQPGQESDTKLSAMSMAQWEDSTLSPNTVSQTIIKENFNRFLREGIAKELSLATLEWLDLPFTETPYQSWYLGEANGYHIFNLQAEGNVELNLLVFDDYGRIRDRETIRWGDQGGGIDFINSQVLQLNLYNEANSSTGIDAKNFLIDLNGQFQLLMPVKFIHPDRKFPEMSSKIIERNALETLDAEMLNKMNDEVLAANGEVFSAAEKQTYFEHTSWYFPGNINEVLELHAIEAYNYANVSLILNSQTAGQAGSDN